MKKILLATSLVLAGSHGAHALNGGVGGPLYFTDGVSFPYCSVDIELNTSFQTANIFVTGSVNRYVGGGLIYFSGSPSSEQAVTLVALEDCLGADPGTVTNLSNFADGTSFAAETRLGFSFDYGGQSYEFSLTGAANTVIKAGAIDTTAPTFDVAPSVGSVTSTGFTPTASIDEAGVIYYVVVADGASAPTAAEIKAGLASGGGGALAAASARVDSAPFTGNFSAITSLTASTAYDVYFVAQDDEGTPNLQSSATKVDATTPAAAPSDTSAPTLASSTPADDAIGVAVGSNIVLTFSENIQAGNGNIVISNGTGDTRTIPVGDAQITIAGTTLTINPTADLNASTSYHVQVAATAVDDLATNSYAGINDTTTLNFTTMDTTAPTPSAATVSSAGTIVTLGMSEALGASTPVASAFVVTVGGVAVSPTAVSISGSNVALTLSSAIEAGSAVSVAYTKPSSGNVLEDAAGNDMASFDTAGSITTTNNSAVDTTAPTPSAATVSSAGTTVTLGMSEALGASTPVASAFVVTVGGVAVSPTAVSISGSNVALTLSSAIEAGSAVSVAYTKPSSGNVLEDAAGNDMASFDTAGSITTTNNSTVDTTAATPSAATVFSEYEDNIRETIVNDVTRSLQSVVGANRLMTQKARERFVDSKQVNAAGQATLSSSNNVAFDVDGTADISGTTLSTKGTFFGQTGNADGTQRRLVFGDFDVQHDGDTGSSTATLTGRIAWERITSSDTMLAYFIGGELAQSNIAGTFDGDQNRIGVTVGGYGVHSLSDNLFAEGFVTLGAGRNNLDMANDVLTLTSGYTTRTATVGGALIGVIEQQGFDIWPELSMSYGRTWIGDVGFTGGAYSLVDSTLSLDAGSVTLANVLFRPEFRIPLDGLQAAQSLSLMTFAPRMICEQAKATTTTTNCGGGAELGIAAHSADGLSNVNAKITADRLGNSTKSGLQFNLEHRF